MYIIPFIPQVTHYDILWHTMTCFPPENPICETRGFGEMVLSHVLHIYWGINYPQWNMACWTLIDTFSWFFPWEAPLSDDFPWFSHSFPSVSPMGTCKKIHPIPSPSRRLRESVPAFKIRCRRRALIQGVAAKNPAIFWVETWNLTWQNWGFRWIFQVFSHQLFDFYTLVMTNSLLLNMTIEIVDFPTTNSTNGDFPQLC